MQHESPLTSKLAESIKNLVRQFFPRLVAAELQKLADEEGAKLVQPTPKPAPKLKIVTKLAKRVVKRTFSNEELKRAIEEHGSVRGASRALGIHHTTITRQLNKLAASKEGAS